MVTFTIEQLTELFKPELKPEYFHKHLKRTVETTRKVGTDRLKETLTHINQDTVNKIIILVNNPLETFNITA